MLVEQSADDPCRERTVRASSHWVRSHAPSAAMMVVAAQLLVLSGIRADGSFLDLQVYRAGGQAWLAGMSLYGPHFPAPLPGPALPFVYPPFAAVSFTVLGSISFDMAAIMMWAASAAASMAACTLIVRRLDLNFGRRLELGCLAGAAVLLLEPEFHNLGFGQVNMILVGLVVIDLLAERTPWPRGMLIGIAAAIKLTPIVFVVYFLVRRQWRPVRAIAASFAACGVVGAILVPKDSLLFWSKELFISNQRFNLAYAANQSLRGTLHRLALPAAVENIVWVVLVVMVGALMWVAVRRCLAQGDELLAMLCIAAATLLASPVSWSAHWVWIGPALVVFTHRTIVARSVRAWVTLCGATAVFAIGPFWLLPQDNGREFYWTGWQQLVGNAYVLCGLAMLVVVATRRHEPKLPAAPEQRRALVDSLT